MKNSIIVVLILTLMGTNAFWIYHFLDFESSHKYFDLEMHRVENENEQLRLLALDMIKGKSVKETKEYFKRYYPNAEPFVKEGYLVIEHLDFKLNDQGLIESIGKI